MLRALFSARSGLRQAVRALGSWPAGFAPSAPAVPLLGSRQLRGAAMPPNETQLNVLKPMHATAAPTPAGLAAQEAQSNELRFDALSPAEFSAVADIFLGHLWTRLERGMREAEGEGFQFEVRPEQHCLRVLLPYDGRMIVRKDMEALALVVESNLYEPFEDRDCREFRPVSALEWRDEDGGTLPAFVADALREYLKVDVRI